MLKKIIAASLLSVSLSSFLAAEAPVEAVVAGSTTKHTMIMYQTDQNVEDRFHEMVEKKINEIGYVGVDPHKRINDAYEKKYGSTTLDLLSFMTVVNPDVVKPLLNIDPRLAGFNPFDLLIYKAKGDKATTVAHLMPEAILDMLDIKDQAIREPYIKSFGPLDAMLAEEIGGKTKYLDYSKMVDDRMMNFELDFKRTEDLDDFIDDFQERFEEAFEAKKYIIAGFYNFKESFDGKDPLTKFDAFWTYSLCHFTFSYNIFDNEGARPEGGVFAPCTMYMYIEKDSNKLVVGMPRLANWAAMVGITDKKRTDFIVKLDKEIPEIMMSLGAKEVESTSFPSQAVAPATATTAATAATGQKQAKAAVAQGVTARKVAALSKAGYEKEDKISTYMNGPLASVEQVSADLKANGFEVLAAQAVDKKGDLTTVVFTCPGLKKMANKKERGFIGVLRVLVDKSNNQITITNPLYFGKAYMQKDFDKVTATKILDKLNGTFEGLKDSTDSLEEDALAHFHFMMGMPYYEEMAVVAKGTNEELLAKVSAGGNAIFELQLENGSILVGVKLGKRTAKFATKVGAANAGILPYTVLIENGEAKALAPKFNIALYYPLLTMSEFMTIATVPGAIIKDLENAFK
ncbi:MAG: hypothetical protein U9Q90_06580 [Campylobacterota bacterium]|nr:hypothetical protein [Campylobacterota bacterium]